MLDIVEKARKGDASYFRKLRKTEPSLKRLVKEGDKAQGPCDHCRKFVPTTYRYKRDHYGKFYVPNILKGCCDLCGRASHMPHQESYKLRDFRVKKIREGTWVE